MARSGILRASPEIVRRSGEGVREDRQWLPALVFLAAFVPYLLTVAPTISWRNGGIDSGELVTAVATLGIPHPTGYPIYVLLGRLFMLLPFGDVAYRVNLMSAVFGALTAVVLAVVGRRLLDPTPSPPSGPLPLSPSPTRGRGSKRAVPPGVSPRFGESSALGFTFAAAAGALVFAFSPLFWSRATIAKEYTLHLFLLAVAIAMLVEWRARRQARYLAGFGLALGLGVGGHLTALAILPAGAAFVVMTDRASVRRIRILGVAAVAALPGVLSYAYLPLRAAQGPALNWGDPSTLPRFVAHVTGSQYQNMLVRLGPAEVIERLLFALQTLPREFGWPAFVCLLVGLWVLGRRDRAFAVLAAVVAGLSVFFAAVYPVRDSEVYLLPAYLVAALFVGAGAREVAGEISEWVRGRSISFVSGARHPESVDGEGVRPRGARGFAAAIPVAIAAGLAIVLAGLSLVTGFGRVDVSGDRAARDYGIAVLRAVEANAIVVGDRDETTFALWYVQQVLGQRPDAAIVDSRLIGWDWYRADLARRYPDLGLQDPYPEAARRLLAGEAPGRPVFNALPPDITTGLFPNPPIQRVRP